MILYALKSALVLMLLYTCFFALTSRETFHRLNRVLLVGSLVLALVVPLIQTKTHPLPLPEGRGEVTLSIINYIPEEIASPTTEVSAPLPSGEGLGVGLLLFGFYFLGFSSVILQTLVQFVALFRYLRGGLRHTDEFGNTVILHRGQVAPFSVFRFIVMSVEDYESNAQHERALPPVGGSWRGAILRYEQAHIRLGHTYDLLLLQAVKAVQWFSPFVWLLDRDLKAVHEYEADESVINFGIDAKQYQQLLVTKAVGNRLQPFANNLRRGSLKKRIIMMYRKKSSRPTMLKALFVVPVTALALCAFATPEVQSAVEAIDKADPTAPIVNKLMTSEPSPASQAQSAEEQKDVLAQSVVAGDSISGIETDHALFIVDGQVQSEEDSRKIDPSTIDNVTVLKGVSAAEVAKEHGLNPSDYKGAVIIVNTKEYVASKVKDAIRESVPANDGEIAVVSYSDNSSPVSDDEIFLTPDVEAKYPGGEAALMMQLARTLRYPIYAMEKKITGHVILQFVVEKDGSIGPIKVQRSLEERCDAEAILAVSKLGKFTPAQHEGKPVRCYLTIPVSFRLN
ncbi:MAG: M56 family metallopeptidase [Bacteroidales bacterium]|nr:M56 family metallopeptidase [Bacteroidales bacterium]